MIKTKEAPQSAVTKKNSSFPCSCAGMHTDIEAAVCIPTLERGNERSDAVYESPRFRRSIGSALRPGGLTLTKTVAERCGLRPGSRVLDIGCGIGATAAFLSEERQYRTVGLDRSNIMISEGKNVHPDLPLINGDAAHLPLKNARLDAVFIECVLSLTENPGEVLAECYRVLAFGGKLVLSDIYARNPAIYNATNMPVRTCLNGAVSEHHARERVEEAGFTIRIWEDHSLLLKQLAGQLVFDFGSQAAFWSQFCPGTASECEIETAVREIREMRPGYYLMIAEKPA